MYFDRIRDLGESKVAARRGVGAVLDTHPRGGLSLSQHRQCPFHARGRHVTPSDSAQCG
jgi:hypothetical protein